MDRVALEDLNERVRERVGTGRVQQLK